MALKLGLLTSVIESYGPNFKIALAIWPLMSTFLTLPLLAYLYHRNGRLSFGAVAAAYLSVLYIVGLGCLTLYPLPSGDSGPGITYGVEPQLIPFTCIADIAKDGFSAVFQIIANIAFFVPLGFICGRFLKLNLPVSIAVGFACSLLIEITQLTGIFGIYPYSYRMFDVDDLINNTIGALFGWFIASLLGRVVPPEKEDTSITTHPGFIRRLVCFWLDMFVIAIPIGIFGISLLVAASLISFARGDGGSISQNMQTACAYIGFIASLAIFILVEGAFPWYHKGQTPAGMFVRMSFETEERTGGKRLAFYILRLMVIAIAIAFPVIAFPILAIFYLFARQMPYDYL